MNLYYDESGDLGFAFKKPYWQGGSSRFLTIYFALVPYGLAKYISRLVRDLYRRKKRDPHNELKAADLTINDKIWIANKTVNLIQKHSDIRLFTITVKKRKVQSHIRSDPNKLYNYSTFLCIKDRLDGLSKVNMYPDPRSIKVRSGNSHIDYLQTAMWFQTDNPVRLIQNQVESRDSMQLQFVDYLANIIWGHYEFRKTKAYNILKRVTALEHFCF